MSDNELMMQAAADCQTEGEQHWGKRIWNEMVRSVGRQSPRQDVMRAIVTSADPVGNFTQLGTQAILNELQAAEHPKDVRDLEEIYTQIRDKQKEEHRARHGRSRR